MATYDPRVPVRSRFPRARVSKEGRSRGGEHRFRRYLARSMTMSARRLTSSGPALATEPGVERRLGVVLDAELDGLGHLVAGILADQPQG